MLSWTLAALSVALRSYAGLLTGQQVPSWAGTGEESVSWFPVAGAVTWAAWTSCFPEGIQGCPLPSPGQRPLHHLPVGSVWVREAPDTMVLCLLPCRPSPKSLVPIFQMRKLWQGEVRSFA